MPTAAPPPKASATGSSGAPANPGERMKQLRAARGMTLAGLARITGKTKGYLSKIERSGKLPPFTTLHTIAQALGVEIDVFLAGSDATAETGGTGEPGGRGKSKKQARAASRNIDLHRGRLAAKPFLQGDSYTYLPLVMQYRNKYMAPFLMKLPPGKSRSFTHDSEEFTYVLEGAVDLIYEKKTHHLAAGDGFYLDSRVEHTFFNASRSEVLMLSVSFNYRRF